VDGWKEDLHWHEALTEEDPISVQLRERIARYEDEGRGDCWLAREDIACLVEGALLHFDGERYRLLAWCVMPNHVHVVIQTCDGHLLRDTIHSWKSFTAKAANRRIERRGDFWMADYHDRFVRDAVHLAAVIAYVESNPVKAGLARHAHEWRFSSAWRNLHHLGPRASRPPCVVPAPGGTIAAG
jgi:REP element-mobilizing transposase RayT